MNGFDAQGFHGLDGSTIILTRFGLVADSKGFTNRLILSGPGLGRGRILGESDATA